MMVLPKEQAKELELWWPSYTAVGTRFGNYTNVLARCTSDRGIAQGQPNSFSEFLADMEIASSILKISDWRHFNAWNCMYFEAEDPNGEPLGAYKIHTGRVVKFDSTRVQNPPCPHTPVDLKELRRLEEWWAQGLIQPYFYCGETEKIYRLFHNDDVPWKAERRAFKPRGLLSMLGVKEFSKTSWLMKFT